MFEFLHGAPYAICVGLKYFYFFVFCLLRVCLGGGRRMDVCVMGVGGESRDV